MTDQTKAPKLNLEAIAERALALARSWIDAGEDEGKQILADSEAVAYIAVIQVLGLEEVVAAVEMAIDAEEDAAEKAPD